MGKRDTRSEKLRGMAEQAIKRGQADEAQRYLAQALRKRADDHAALATMAELRLADKDVLQAIFCYAHAIKARANIRSYKERFVDLAGSALAANYSADFASALVACFRTPDLDCTKASRFWWSLVVAEPDFHAAFSLAERRGFEPSNRAFFENLRDFGPLFSPLFLEGLRNLLPFDPLFEEFVTHIRRHLWSDLGVRLTAEKHTTLACALSHYAFATDFILDVTSEERRRIGELRHRIESGEETAGDAASIALLACYEPLHTLTNEQQILERYQSSDSLGSVVKTQIADHFALQNAASRILSLTQIREEVSEKVREQYESFPYPRWKTFAKERLVANWRSWQCSVEAEGPLRGKKARVLVPGCGTGQEAAMVATILSDATVTAFDLSRNSLAYATMRTQALGLDNVVFRQGDILELGQVEERFDYISSTGVLHHLQDPVAGWAALCRLLKPGGLMRLGLYSEAGRRAVAAARDAIGKRNFSSDREGMLSFRRESPKLLDRGILLELAKFRDYYHMSGYRDLLFHVEEHRFDALEIAKVLRQLCLTFERFYLASDALKRYREMFPADRDGTDLENWHEFEQRHPETFRAMYIFWCRKREPASRRSLEASRALQ